MVIPINRCRDYAFAIKIEGSWGFYMIAGPDEVPQEVKVQLREDVGERNPYMHFMVSEAYATATAGVVYCFARLVAWLIQLIDGLLPLIDERPMLFVEGVMSWGGAIATAAVFLLITAYQLVVLFKRLHRGLVNE